MYTGPVIDAFLHTPWIGGEDPADTRGDRVDWSGDTRLRRVMHTFSHNDASGQPAASIGNASLREEMAKAGVERVLLPAKIYYQASEKSVVAVHRQLEQVCAGSDDTIRWGCSLVPPELGPGTYWDFMQNPRLIKEAARHAGLAAVHITPSPWGTPPNHKWYYPAYAACAELGLPLLVYVGMPGPLWPMEPNDPMHLDEVALAFPDLKIVAHHIGDPWVDIAVRLAARHPNFYICTSAWSPKAYPKALMEFLKGRWHGTTGCDKVIFASDFPLLDMQRTVRDLRQLDLTEEQHTRFAYENARQVFWA
ncbi:MAG: amidohydrolase family protein [Pseudomonadota bacterium]